MMFKMPYIATKGSKIRLTLKDLSGSENNIYMAFQGRKLYVPVRDINEVLNSFPQYDTERAALPTMVDVPTRTIPRPFR